MLRVFILQNVPIPASAIAAIARDSASSIGSNSFTRLQMGETDLQIESYDLFLDVDFRNLRFDGKVKIKLESENDVKLNSVELEILEVDANGNPVKYELEGEDFTVRTGKFAGELSIKYRGSISDKLVGLYKAAYDGGYVASTQFEAVSARRLLPCLDHPAYKADFKLTVKTDSDNSVISNMPPTSVRVEGPKKTVEFPKTPRMSTYLLYLGIGKFEEVKDRFNGVDYIVATVPGKSSGAKYPLGVARDSVKFFESYFGSKYNLPKLHLIAVPEFAAGAMENWGAITFREIVLLVDKDSSIRIKKQVAEVIAHEISHQWFGDLVTMKWWDDLWLNESFATFASVLAQTSATEFTQAWTTFATVEKSWAYRQDQLPSTHPIAADIPDLAAVEVNFDGITYAKGASVLKQLVAYVGLEHFMTGLRDYFRAHAFGNATFDDLLTALEKASGRDLSDWGRQWLKTTGLNTLRADFDVDADGRFTRFAVAQSGAAPGAGETRVHRLAIGIYDDDGSGKLTRSHREELDISGASTEVDALIGVSAGRLVLVNDDDLTYCSLRLDSGSLDTALSRIADIAEPLPRTLVWSAAWEMTRDAELRARDFVS